MQQNVAARNVELPRQRARLAEDRLEVVFR
jgi:hypothetical protein